MPELPEVETVRRGLCPRVINRRIRSAEVLNPHLRRPVPPGIRRSVEGATIISVRRRGKYLLLDTDKGTTLVVHLGMTGRLLHEIPGKRADRSISSRHDHVVFTLDDGSLLTYNDPRRFGLIDLCPTTGEPEYLSGMGPEPLGEGFAGNSLIAGFGRKRSPVKTVLMDQAVVAGVGNIYACEALWRSRISPFRQAASITRPEADLLSIELRGVLGEAIGAGGSSLRDYRNAEGGRGGFQERFAVYGREGEPCPRCGEPVIRATQSGRSTFYCGSCQS